MASEEDFLLSEFAQLDDLFPDSDLVLTQREKQGWTISGRLRIRAHYLGDHVIDDEYKIQINIPADYPYTIPHVEETAGRIPPEFHTYDNGSLCLGAPLAVKRTFNKNPTLVGFFSKCLVPYLYAFSYKEQTGRLPFGELSHGGLGLLEYYQDIFHCQDLQTILDLLSILSEENYRGHRKCPCRSGERLRSCHGPILLELKQHQEISEFQFDHRIIKGLLIETAQR